MNKYEIKGIVGEGAYGIVYQARHKETGEIGKFNTKYVNSYACAHLWMPLDTVTQCVWMSCQRE